MKSLFLKNIIALITLLILPFTSQAFSNHALTRELRNDLSQDEKEELTYTAKNCSESKNLKSIAVRKDHSDDKSEMTRIWYEYIPANQPTEKTIVFIPGGPGATSIGSNFLPNDYNRIQIDLRGVGCNFGTALDFPETTMTSAQAAIDVALIISKEELKTYIIHGHSYGTLLATHLGSILNKFTQIQPTAIILEGTMYGAYKDWSEYIQQRLDVLNREISNELRSHLSELMGKDQNVATFIGTIISNSYSDDGPEETQKIFSKLMSIRDQNELKLEFPQDYKMWMTVVNGTTASKPSKTSYVLNAISCKETTAGLNENRFSPIFDGKTLKVVAIKAGYEPCIDYKHEPYDPGRYQITAPIYYFQGDRDAATPIQGAMKHYLSQKENRKKVFVQLQGRGHSPLHFDLNKCLGRVYSNIFNGDPESFNKIFSSAGKCFE